jgi:hypothetical protein
VVLLFLIVIKLILIICVEPININGPKKESKPAEIPYHSSHLAGSRVQPLPNAYEIGH